MKRKTNLFYTTGTDSSFITFSNYTESMTGHFLSTNTKLFPSKFLCLDIPALYSDNGKVSPDKKTELIQKLAAQYENKAAFLRDMCTYHGYNIEEKVKPLGWLIDTICEYDGTTEFTFASQVTEQDYNGIYADTICVIDSSECVNVTRVEQERSTELPEEYTADKTYLYGWSDTKYDEATSSYSYEYIGPEEYKGIAPELDGDGNYYYSTKTSYLYIEPADTPADITFNCVIPLFDVINTDKNENTDIIQQSSYIYCDSDTAAIIDVPYGIWFANTRTTLARDTTGHSPSWSLAIGSQFKPFPYSHKYEISEVPQSARGDAFMTFSQTLVRQNALLEKMMKVSSQIAAMNDRISEIESRMKSIGTQDNIDSINIEIASLTEEHAADIAYLQAEIDKLKDS